MDFIKVVEEAFKREVPTFVPGDTIKVYTKVVEGDKERLQPFEGIVIGRRGSGTSETFVVRKMSFGVGVEKIFPLCSPAIDHIEVIRQGKVRRAKLFYLRDKKGKSAKVKERDTRQAKG